MLYLKLERSMWVKKFNLHITFMYIHFSRYVNLQNCIVDTADIRKILDVFYIYFFGQWLAKIKLKKLYPHLWVCEQFCCKVLVQNGGYSLFCAWSLTLQINPPDQNEHWPFFPDLAEKCDGRNFSYTETQHWLVAQNLVI